MNGPATIAIVIVAFISSCATFGPRFEAFGHCTTKNLLESGKKLAIDVATTFADPSYTLKIAGLALQFGDAEVKCAVDSFIKDEEGRRGASPAAMMVLSRAKAWRTANP